MITNENINRISICFFIINSVLASNVFAKDDDESENRFIDFIEIGTSYEYSDNIYKASDDEITGNTKSADISVGYKKVLPTTNISLKYNAEYSDTSEDDLDDSNYWIGISALSQQVFSKNLIFNFNHVRQRYILNQNEAALESNTDEKDSLSGGLQWSIPYSAKSSFVLGLTRSQVWYDDNDSNDYGSNIGKASWQYALDERSQLQLIYTGSQKDFNNVDYTYTEHNIDAVLVREYKLGNYSFDIGQSWIETDSSDYTSTNYGFNIDATIRQHYLAFNASYELTNTADQIGTDNDIDSTDYEIYEQTNLSVQYQYSSSNKRLTNSLRLYYINDQNIDDSDSLDKDQYGIYGGVNWALTNKWSWNVAFNYYELHYESSGTKKYTDTEISTRYNFTSSLYLQLSAASENLQYVDSSNDYQEQVYTTRIAYTY